MLDVFDKFAVNLDAELNGTWKTFMGAQFLIARSGNKNFNKALTDGYTTHAEVLDKKDEAADKVAEKILNEAIANTLILDWKGVAYQGKEVKYTRQNAIELLSKPELRDFRLALLSMADDVENFLLKHEEEQTKNS